MENPTVKTNLMKMPVVSITRHTGCTPIGGAYRRPDTKVEKLIQRLAIFVVDQQFWDTL